MFTGPSKWYIVIGFTGIKPEKVTIRIIDSMGKLIFEKQNYMLMSRECPANISNVAAGVYLLQVQHQGRNQNRRVVVQH